MRGMSADLAGTRVGARPALAQDGARLAAAMFVVVCHYFAFCPAPPTWLGGLFAHPNVATDFFIVSSGFVLSQAYGRRIVDGEVSVHAFLRRRIQRIAPPHILVLTAYAVLVALSEAAGYHPAHLGWFAWRELPAQMLLLQALGAPGGHGWNYPTWTLSALLCCYFAFPVIWRLQARLQSRWMVLSVSVLTLVVADLMARSTFGVSPDGLPLQYCLVRALPLFGIGIAVARLSQDRAPNALMALIAALAGGLALAAYWLWPTIDLLPPAAALCWVAALALAPALGVPRRFRLPANLSFHVYLVHTVWGSLWFGATHLLSRSNWAPAASWVSWLVSLVGALVAAWAFGRWVDQPMQRWFADRDRTRRAAASEISLEAPAAAA